MSILRTFSKSGEQTFVYKGVSDNGVDTGDELNAEQREPCPKCRKPFQCVAPEDSADGACRHVACIRVLNAFLSPPRSQTRVPRSAT